MNRPSTVHPWRGPVVRRPRRPRRVFVDEWEAELIGDLTRRHEAMARDEDGSDWE